MTQYLSGKNVIDKLAVDFELINTFSTVCTQLPPISYVDHVKLSVMEKEMANLELAFVDQWKKI